MICLAIPRSVLGDAEVFAHHIATLNGRGWQVAEIIGDLLVWHDKTRSSPGINA